MNFARVVCLGWIACFAVLPTGCESQTDGSFSAPKVLSDVPGQTAFRSLSAAQDTVCGLRLLDSRPVCWGATWGINPPNEAFTELSVGGSSACGLRSDGTVSCWGNPKSSTLKTLDFGSLQVASITATSGDGACARLSNGTVRCWGQLFSESQNVTTDITLMSDAKWGPVASAHAICALRTDSSVTCYYDAPGRPAPPSALGAETLAATAAGSGMCSLLNGHAECWGEYASQSAVPALQQFKQLALTRIGVFGLRDDGTLAHWGLASDGDERIPSGESFSSVTGAAGFVCGLRASGVPVCWGGGQLGQADVPAALQ